MGTTLLAPGMQAGRGVALAVRYVPWSGWTRKWRRPAWRWWRWWRRI